MPLLLRQALGELPEATLHGALTHLQAAEFLYETRPFPELNRPSSMPSPSRSPTKASSMSGGAPPCPDCRGARGALRGPGGRAGQRLAHHALRGEVWDKALAYCRQAGEKAMARSAHREAAGYFEQALGALAHLPETRATLEQAIDLRVALRSALWPSGDLGRTAKSARGRDLRGSPRPPASPGTGLDLLSENFRFMGAYDQAIAAAQRALALATASGEVVLRAHPNQRLGLAYQAQGDYRRAIDRLGQSVASFDGAQRREHFGQVVLPAVLSRADLAWRHAELGTFAEGRTRGKKGSGLLRKLRTLGASRTPITVSVAAFRQGDLPSALPRLEPAMGICQEADLPLFFPWIAAALGAAYARPGRVADAVPLLTQAMEQATTTETVVHQALCGLSLGEAQVLAGSLEEAHALTEGVLAHARERQEHGYQAKALRFLPDIAARRGPPQSRAEAHYRQALALAEELGMRPLGGPLPPHPRQAESTLDAAPSPHQAGSPPSTYTSPST